jgi:hypothetical protein
LAVRTTVNIEESALDLGKKRAAETGRSLGSVISDALLQAYSGRPTPRKSERYDLPVSGKGGMRPGVDLDNSAALEDLMDGLR